MPSVIGRYLRYTSWPIITATAALIFIGLMAIRVAEASHSLSLDYSGRQTLFALVGLAAFLATTLVPYQKIGRVAYPLFGVALVLLVLVLFLPANRSARRWIEVGSIQIQPSEIMKIAYVVMLAWYLRYRDNFRTLGGLIVPWLLTLVPLGLVLKEPDLGTSLLLLPTLFFMLFLAGARVRHLLGIAATALVLVFLPVPMTLPADKAAAKDYRAVAYWTYHRGGREKVLLPLPLRVINQYQVQRVDGWLHQGDDSLKLERGLQLNRSKTAMGAGGWLGTGDWVEEETYLLSLPERQTDFIFAVLAGRWGFLACLGVLALYGVIIIFGLEIASVTADPFGRLLAVGMLALLLSQLFINVGMTMGLMPITGMTMPLVSYGGSSLVINCAAMGLLVNVGMRRPIQLGKKPFEHGDGRWSARLIGHRTGGP